MFTRRSILIITGCALPLLCLAADESAAAHVDAPVLGYLFDPAAGAVRPLLGIPGASITASPLATGARADAAAIAQDRGYALLIAAKTHRVRLERFQGDQVTARSLPAIGTARRAWISASGGTAALYRAADQTLSMLTGLPDAPASAGLIDIWDLGQPGALAVSDDGQYVAAAFSSAAGPAAFVLGVDGTRVALPLTAPVTALAFRRSSTDLLAADAANQVWLFRDVVRHPTPALLGGPEAGINAPVAVAFSADGTLNLVANSGNGTIVAWDGQGGVNAVACGCTPTALEPLNGASLFRITDLSDKPLLVFDAQQSRVLFVPPPSSGGPLEAAQ